MADSPEDSNNLSKTLLARLNHPVIGLFIGSWIVWNWEVIYWLLCGIKDPGQTISIVSTQYLRSDRWHDLVTVPLLATVAYVLLGPFLIELNTLYKDLLKTAREFLQAMINKLRPVPRIDLERVQKEVSALQHENRILENCYNYSAKKTILGPDRSELDMRQVLTSYFNFGKQQQDDRKKLTELEAELQIEKKKNALK